ncbi:MAG TPA: kelch repeat-containing protein [Verrucomicrobiae bacterium]|nr:kelch repeat-containing protein [Verrucomicrobiae bacterium]
MYRSCALAALVATLSFLFNDSVKAQSTPPEIAGTWQGRIEALVVDGVVAGTARTRYFLHTSEDNFELQGTAGTVLRSGQMVEVAGHTAGRHLTVSHVTTSASAPTPTACAAAGDQKAAVILVSFPSKALLSSVTPALVRSSFFGTGRTVDTFLRESSFGHTWITGDVLGPYVLDADYFDEPLAIRDAALRAAAPFADLTQYTRFFVVAPQGQSGMDSGGMALLGCGQISSPQGNLNASSIWMGAESMVGPNEIVDIATHELGHGFGLEHARFADYGSDVLGPAGETPAPWDTIHEYGDNYSSMGRNSAQWAAPQKALLGWLQTANIKTVTAAGTFTLSPYELTGGNQVLRVSRGTGSGDWLWVEFRQPQGTFDATLPSSLFAGALVHYEDSGLTATLEGVDPATYSNLVNFHPAPPYVTDPVLHSGQTWHDAYGSLSLTVNSVSSAGLNLSVSYAPASVCPASVSSTQPFNAGGGSGVLSVSAPSSCGWTTTASVPWITVGWPVAGSANGNVNYTIAPNADVAPRWGKITVGGAFAIITQAGASGGWVTLSPLAATIPASGGTGEIAVATSAPDFAWTNGMDVPWITDVECSCFLEVGPATLRYTVAANPGPQRTGHISAGGVSFTITQEAGAGTASGVTFTQLAPVDAPPARMSHAMAPFGHSGQAILYGGAWDTTFFADTWLWNGSNWSLLKPANDPGLLTQHAMAYDDAHGKIVLFGGTGPTGAYSNQTWVWDGNNWTEMHPKVSPPARYGHAMVYDSVSRKIIMFGGYGDFAEMNDTWTWDGSNWTQVASTTNPPPRSQHAMAFDATRGQIVMFGGFLSQPSPTFYSDTWLWDAKGWHQVLISSPPAARFGQVMAYHPVLQSVVMVGGYGGKDVTDTTWNYDFRRETWLWNGQSWTQQFPAVQPGPAYTIGAAWDNTRQALTVHVGDDLTCLSRGPKTFVLSGPSH